MHSTPENPRLNNIISEIIESQIFDRFIGLLNTYGISRICDCHMHVSSGRNDMIPGVSEGLTPPHPFSVTDILYFYDSLFADRMIQFAGVVFDTPLPVYDMDKKNRMLLNDPEGIAGEENRLIRFVVITPDMSGEQIQTYLSMGAKGFKITPRTTSAQMKPRSVHEISLFEMIHPASLEAADRLRLPMVLHLPQLVVAPRMRESIKEELLKIRDTYPGIKIILAHLGQAQTLYKIGELLEWMEVNHLCENIWMDISAVTASPVLVAALEGPVKLLFGTDIDFALAQRGKYITYSVSDGKRVLADEDNSDKAITALVSTHFGKQLKAFASDQGIDLDRPLFLFQLEGILNAVDGLKHSGVTDDRIKKLLEDLFYRNAELLLGLIGHG